MEKIGSNAAGLLWILKEIACSQPLCRCAVQLLSRVQLFMTPWTVARQAPLPRAFSRQECWSGLPFPFPGDLPDPEVEPGSPVLQADSLPTELQGEPHITSLVPILFEVCMFQLVVVV